MEEITHQEERRLTKLQAKEFLQERRGINPSEKDIIRFAALIYSFEQERKNMIPLQKSRI